MSNIIVPGKKKQIKILIGQPLIGGITIKPYVANMDLLIQTIIKQFKEDAPFIVHSSVRGTTYLDQSREEIAKQAIDEDYDYLFFIDADMIFRPDILEKLFYRHKGIIGAIYSYRCGKEHGPCIYEYDKKTGAFNNYQHWPVRKGVVKVGGIGTGLLLMKISVLKKIPVPRFAYLECITPDAKGNRRRLGEDLSFCIRCRENKINIYADTDRWTGHLGEKMWTYKDFQLRMIVEKEGYKGMETLSIG